MDSRLNIEELIDLVNQSLTLNCTIPTFVTADQIRRIATQEAARYFYRYYKYALQRTYYYVDLQSLYGKTSTNIKFITLPDEIEAIKWVYMVNYNDMHNLGFLMPKGSINFGPTSQPYVASINVSEWAESVAVMQNFQDAISTFNKNTVKFAFDPNSKRFEVQTSLKSNIMLEVYAHIPEEALFGDPLFIKYVTGKGMIELSIRLSFNDMQLAGNTKINADKFYEQGTKMVEEVMAAIKAITNSGFFFNKTR